MAFDGSDPNPANHKVYYFSNQQEYDTYLFFIIHYTYHTSTPLKQLRYRLQRRNHYNQLHGGVGLSWNDIKHAAADVWGGIKNGICFFFKKIFFY